MAHSAVWGHPLIKRQNTNSKKLMIEKLSKSGLILGNQMDRVSFIYSIFFLVISLNL